MIYGYARVSTEDQKLHLQTDALKVAGCEKIYSEKISASKERPELEKLIQGLKKGDTVIVWKLDRLGRSLRHLIDLVKDFEDKGVKFVSLQDSINTATAQGRLIFNIFASLAEFERDIIRERTHAGLAAARARGRLGGRKKGISPGNQLIARYAKELYDARELSIKQILIKTGIKTSKTFYRYIRTDLSHLDVAESKKGRIVGNKR